MPYYQPLNLFLDNKLKASDNATLLRDALDKYVNGIAPPPNEGLILLLPKGKIYTDQIDLTDTPVGTSPNIRAAHAGLVIQGSGTETKLINLAGMSSPYVIAANTGRFGYLDPMTY